MKNIFLIICCIVTTSLYAQENIITLEPNQSMGITGQGPGRDGAINEYYGQDSVAIIKNLGTTDFDARVKDSSGEVTITKIPAGKSIKIKVYKGSVLYYDSTEAAKTAVTFVKMQTQSEHKF